MLLLAFVTVISHMDIHAKLQYNLNAQFGVDLSAFLDV